MKLAFKKSINFSLSLTELNCQKFLFHDYKLLILKLTELKTELKMVSTQKPGIKRKKGTKLRRHTQKKERKEVNIYTHSKVYVYVCRKLLRKK